MNPRAVRMKPGTVQELGNIPSYEVLDGSRENGRARASASREGEAMVTIHCGRLAFRSLLRIPCIWCYLLVSMVLAYYAGIAVPLAKASGMSLAEYALYVLADHYYLIYAWFFFLLFWIAQTVRKHGQQEWIRYGSCCNKYNTDNLKAILQITLMILGNLILVLFVGIAGVGVSGGYQADKVFGDMAGNMMVLTGYARIFPDPVIAVMCVVLYWDMGCIFLYFMLYYGNLIGGRKMMIAEILLCIISTLAGYLTQVDESGLNVLFFNNYYILHHALLLVGPQAVGVNMLVMLLGGIGLRRVAICKRKIPT